MAAPETLGRQLHMIYDGASLSARMDHDPTASVAARAAAETLLDAALAAGLIFAGLAVCGAYCRLVDSDAGSGLTLPSGVRLASRGQVAAAWFLGLALLIATAGIGYIAWSVFTWSTGVHAGPADARPAVLAAAFEPGGRAQGHGGARRSPAPA